MAVPNWLTARPVAHRGLHDLADGVLENTPTAARAAAEAGFPIECDVQLTADGEAVVFHDFTLDRLTAAAGRLDERTAAELATVPFKATTDRIPTLDAYLDLIGGRVPLIIEIKSRFDGDLRLTRRVAEIVNRRPEPVALMSFDPAIVEALIDLAPGKVRGVVAEAHYVEGEWTKLDGDAKRSLGHLLHVGRSRPDFLAWHVKDLPHAVPNMARHFGMPVLTWTVRTPDDRARAAEFADQMIFEGFRP
ncbi:glycerophosphodiester phosphodiesterase family protein [Chelatococcus sp. SYSU_G07232]|uniref:Glycerophosphodiester phosphodiesterase family protein n=1 Tax=Chelatococcus albus TaxID=3047466 RepID=A0ABT7ACZ6_9HYPH|nr:glycerophosphodiester phosphodiesterase family protein [Chelatococcus sp. SYSU_G07232]MDJ1157208.1 glycerophosphodiester phosphodiesterase family protein [Chelatococcus sp. SYSU_G07232]